LQSFIDNNLFTGFNHFERLAFGSYGYFESFNPPDTYKTWDDIRTAVNNKKQEAKKAVVRR
jgi:hypothetical protein